MPSDQHASHGGFRFRPSRAGQWLAQSPGFAAVSPDGTDIAYIASGRLYHRSLEANEVTVLAEGSFPVGPFFSPDGDWVAYWSGEAAVESSARGRFAAGRLCVYRRYARRGYLGSRRHHRVWWRELLDRPVSRRGFGG